MVSIILLHKQRIEFELAKKVDPKKWEIEMSFIPVTDIDQILNLRVIRLASKLSLIFQRETLRPAGVSVQQWRILVSLAQSDNLHLRSLARHSSQDPAHTSRVAKTMILKGWISSRPDDEDNRRIRYLLTAEGTELVKRLWPDAKKFAADVAELFDESEFEQFKNMLDTASGFCEARLIKKEF